MTDAYVIVYGNSGYGTGRGKAAKSRSHLAVRRRLALRGEVLLAMRQSSTPHRVKLAELIELTLIELAEKSDLPF